MPENIWLEPLRVEPLAHLGPTPTRLPASQPTSTEYDKCALAKNNPQWGATVNKPLVPGLSAERGRTDRRVRLFLRRGAHPLLEIAEMFYDPDQIGAFRLESVREDGTAEPAALSTTADQDA